MFAKKKEQEEQLRLRWQKDTGMATKEPRKEAESWGAEKKDLFDNGTFKRARLNQLTNREKTCLRKIPQQRTDSDIIVLKVT